MAIVEFKDRLAQAIEASGKTQREIAVQAGIGESLLSLYLRGSEPRLKNRLALLDALPLLRTLELEALTK